MNAALISSLSEKNRLFLAQTEPSVLRGMSEDELLVLHDRVRLARDKQVSRYRRAGSKKVKKQGGRGLAKETNRRNADRAEAFEDALARVSRQLAVAASASARELRTARLAAARAEREAGAAARKAAPRKAPARKAPTRKAPANNAAGPNARSGERSLRSPSSVQRKSTTTAANARRQAKRDAT